jgi:hypothetical protein
MLTCCANPAVAQTAMQAAFSYDFQEQATAPAPASVADPLHAQEPGQAVAPGYTAPGYTAPGYPAQPGVACQPYCEPYYSGQGGCSLFGDCCLGDPCSLRSHLVDDCCWLDFGGWTQIGYHSNNTRLSANRGDLFAFNDVPDQLNLHQQWAWFEKVASPTACGWDWGFRFDMLYGTDAQKTQAFGNSDNSWDVSLDHGVYGWAMPQAYLELAYGDWSVIAGHFFTLVGYEVIPAPDNFFYSHALTMFNSEPFTHTGAVATYSGMENMELYMGWTAGWDTGFDQFNGGSNWLGGFSTALTDDVSFTYISTGGDLGWRSPNGTGYSHSLVFDFTLTEKLNYVLQSDHVSADSAPGFQAVDVGINQYLFYTINDCWAVGSRMEWWKSNNVTGNATSFQEVTVGANYKPHANVVIRPEYRYDWTNESAANATLGYNQSVFGIDAIFLY